MALARAHRALPLGQAEPQLPPLSGLRYHKLLHEVVLDGREAYHAMLRDPAQIIARAERSTLETQLWGLALLRYEQLMAFVLIFRAGELAGEAFKAGVPGIFEYYGILSQIVPPSEEFRLQPKKHPNGEHTVPNFYPPQWPELEPQRKSLSESTPGDAPGLPRARLGSGSDPSLRWCLCQRAECTGRPSSEHTTWVRGSPSTELLEHA